MRRIAESTVRRLSIYLSFLEEIQAEGVATTSSDDLAKLGGTTSAQVRKDLSFFGSFGKRGLGYSVPELAESLREILGLGKQWRVCIIGAGKISAALARYAGFEERGFNVTGLYDSDPAKVGHHSGNIVIRDTRDLEKDVEAGKYDIGVIILRISGHIEFSAQHTNIHFTGIDHKRLRFIGSHIKICFTGYKHFPGFAAFGKPDRKFQGGSSV